MIRVVYRWKVEPRNFAAFESTWRATTDRIHETVPGALGSFLLRGSDDESEVLTVAKWESLGAWQAFWQGSNPEAMVALGSLAERLSAVAYEEIGDHTR